MEPAKVKSNSKSIKLKKMYDIIAPPYTNHTVLKIQKQEEWVIGTGKELYNDTKIPIYKLKGGTWNFYNHYDHLSYIWGYHQYVDLNDKVFFERLTAEDESGIMEYKDVLDIMKDINEETERNTTEQGDDYEEDEGGNVHWFEEAARDKETSQWICQRGTGESEVYTRFNSKKELVAFVVLQEGDDKVIFEED
jgi:hypothetical protein